MYVLSQSESILLPQQWSVGKEDIDLVGKKGTVQRAVFARGWDFRASAERIAKFYTQLFQQVTIRGVRWVRNEDLDAYLFG